MSFVLLLAASLFSTPEDVPVSFTYDGRSHRGLGGFPLVENTLCETGGVLRVKVDETLEARVVAKADVAYGAREYTVWFENVGTSPSRQLDDVWSFVGSFPGGQPVLRGMLGDHANKYAAYEHDLSKADKYFRNISGRATHVDFPYFDLVHGEGGTIVALGWAGTWEAVFSAVGDETSLRLRTGYNWHMRLLPGEKVRTGLVVLLDYDGRDQDHAMNKWRRWFVACNMPRANAAGKPVEPFSTAYFAYDTGRPNSDGSISEGHDTWRQTLDKLVAERLVADFRWFDAGWYCDTEGKSVPEDWWGRIGTWEIDPAKWPGDSLRASNDACRKAGMRAYCWFEPERTASAEYLDGLVRNYGYRREWACVNPCDAKHAVNHLGIEACYQWVLGRILNVMDKGGFDLYREDFNTNPEPAWWQYDFEEAKRLGFDRFGMAENKIIQGHYRLWDDIIAYGARTGKCTFIDSCASGGGRNDIESLRRAIPFLRSDADRTATSLRLSMTTSFTRWIPFSGACVREGKNALKPEDGPGPDAYVARASFLPIWHLQEAFSRNDKLDWDRMRRNFAEWKSVRHLLTKDFYPLSPCHHETELRDWVAFAYDWPESGESMLLAFRMEECPRSQFVARLKFAVPSATYEIVDADSGRRFRRTGEELRRGFTVSLDRPRMSALFRITRK